MRPWVRRPLASIPASYPSAPCAVAPAGHQSECGALPGLVGGSPIAALMQWAGRSNLLFAVLACIPEVGSHLLCPLQSSHGGKCFHCRCMFLRATASPRSCYALLSMVTVNDVSHVHAR